MNERNLTVEALEEGIRLDQFLNGRYPQYSRSYFQGLIEQKRVLVNGTWVKKRTSLTKGDRVALEFTLEKECDLIAEAIDLDILYEDEFLLAIHKPAGMVVHPAAGNWKGTFVNALLHHCHHLENKGLRPGIVHRLDKETTGVLLAAKDEHTQRKLISAFANREVKKEYLAICLGNPGNQTLLGTIGRHPQRRKAMALLQDRGKEARTDCQTLAYNSQISLVKLIPHTGRTHQLRVHMQSIGTPILGDALYGFSSSNRKWGATRQLLHAHILRFTHPNTQEKLELKAPIPEDMRRFMNQLAH